MPALATEKKASTAAIVIMSAPTFPASFSAVAATGVKRGLPLSPVAKNSLPSTPTMTKVPRP